MATDMDMTTDNQYEPQDKLHGVLAEALHVRTHFELMMWLQGNFQQFIAHDVMIAAWGDFSLGIIYIDIVSALPGVRTGQISSANLTHLLQSLFVYWQKNAKTPFSLSVDKGIFHDHEIGCIEANINLKKMKCVLVHGIKDFRGGHDCIYVMFSSIDKMPGICRKHIATFLPYIDYTLRQLEHLPEQLPEELMQIEQMESEIIGTLSPREAEIMEWVKSGKTNQDIGSILNISAFTVKNHMQRIFKKLDVLNRAQAVTKYNRMYQTQ